VSLASGALIIYAYLLMMHRISGKMKRGWILLLSLLCVIPFYLLYIPVSLLSHNILNYPAWMCSLFVSLLTLLLLALRIRGRFIIPVLLLMGGFIYFVFYPNWFSYFTMKKPEQFTLLQSKLVDINNREITTADLKGKVILFDLWHSACYSCIKEFPQLQALYDEYKGDSSVKIISLNIPLDQDNGIRPTRYSNQYSFEKLYFKDEKEYQRFYERPVPLVLILDKNMNCRYAGQLNTDWNVYVGNAKTIINQLKSEK
jgi:thiol-disulfide isomerase/thioredoxin